MGSERRARRAQSSVVGSLLLVAVVAITSSMVGAAGALNLAAEPTPTAAFDVQFEGSDVTLTYTGADRLDGDELSVLVSEGSLSGDDWPDEVRGGASVTLTHSDGWDGQRLQVVWRDGAGDGSAVLVRTDAPTAG